MTLAEQQKQTAGEILQQLGGRRFIAFTGACNFVALENGMMCRIKAGRKITHLEIKLNSLDLYNMKFYKVSGAKITIVAEKNNVYNDMLEEIFSNVTGLATRF